MRGTLLAHWTRYMHFCSQSQLTTLEWGAARPAAEPSLASHDGLMQGNKYQPGMLLFNNSKPHPPNHLSSKNPSKAMPPPPNTPLDPPPPGFQLKRNQHPALFSATENPASTSSKSQEEMREEVDRRERAAMVLGSWEQLAWHSRMYGEVC